MPDKVKLEREYVMWGRGCRTSFDLSLWVEEIARRERFCSYIQGQNDEARAHLRKASGFLFTEENKTKQKQKPHNMSLKQESEFA